MLLILHNSIQLGLFYHLLNYFQPHFLHSLLKILSRLLNYVMDIMKFDTGLMSKETRYGQKKRSIHLVIHKCTPREQNSLFLYSN